MALVPDEQDGVALGRVPARLGVHLGDERAGRVDRPQPARVARSCTAGDAVGREDEHRAERDVLLALDEDGATLLEVPTTCVLWIAALTGPETFRTPTASLGVRHRRSAPTNNARPSRPRSVAS